MLQLNDRALVVILLKKPTIQKYVITNYIQRRLYLIWIKKYLFADGIGVLTDVNGRFFAEIVVFGEKDFCCSLGG